MRHTSLRAGLRPIGAVVALVITLGACTSAGDPGAPQMADLPETNVEAFETRLAGLDQPAVVNIWASWCLPCRSEAPLLNEAHQQFGDRIVFIGVDVEDSQTDAKRFIEEFDLRFEQLFDHDRSIARNYGGLGTPITLFFAAHGELFDIHNGIVDERALALSIDDLLALE